MTHPLLLFVLAMALCCHGRTATAETVLDTVSVEAEAPDEGADETATITTLDAKQLSESMATSIKDAVRYEPGISVTNNPSRFGLGGFNIRGVEDNRVLMQIDGVRLPESFSIGGYANSGRNLVDIALLKRMDIQRGSASALYGSGALGGAVSYVTPEPEDWLENGRPVGGGIEVQYHSANDSNVLVPTLAAGNETLKLLLRGVRRHGTETETKGTRNTLGLDRTVANPQEDTGLSGLVKLAFTPDARLRTTLTFENFSRDIDTNYLSNVRTPIKDVHTEDGYRRQRLSFDQRIAELPLGTLDFKLYRQTNRTTQDTYEYRQNTPTLPSLVDRNFEQEQDITGLRLAFDTAFEAEGAHRIQWGLEASRRETVQMRDGQEYYPTRNQTEKTVGGIKYPARDYPPSTINEIGLFAQDTWMLSDAWSLQFGLRYDRYDLKVEPDALYLSANPTAHAKPLQTDALSPKLGAIWRFSPGFELIGQYAWGFRAPPFDDVNIGFTNSGAYVAIANPDLEAETSHGPELTLRHIHARGQWHFTAFDTHYTNFIEQETVYCPRGPATRTDPLGPLLPGADPLCSTTEKDTYQARNLDGVRIYGLEAGFRHAFTHAWSARGSLAYARGRDTDNNPIDSVNPLTATLGLIYTTGPWKIESTLSMAREKSRNDARRETDGSLRRQFLPEGYAVLDLRAHWHFAQTGRLSIGVMNLFDVKYALWADVPVADIHVPDSSFGPDRYSQPGRNVSLSLSYDFK
ncbi:TonB-dependent hemoglobin/transferrin/lactoferrin family receptor [Betaproteobacteria bacterium SCN1]|mgnify:CR=1 FL=1|jgi:hemoglobin/transferrin/lactoferrin receptor protein|nr:TonB-dependent hemoglobin/transferrin/lactoferrin family receptor [Betaproteobacteria bacterium SCN1]MBN8759260.1 TonB-dependent hemoglobin/transferrin/lactoferrin family receptor [Thiobacillus sp.]ODU90213.1 MAG: hypothetical protein ABT21_06075 [Thiobacillus sp. SCN 65-179]